MTFRRSLGHTREETYPKECGLISRSAARNRSYGGHCAAMLKSTRGWLLVIKNDKARFLPYWRTVPSLYIEGVQTSGWRQTRAAKPQPRRVVASRSAAGYPDKNCNNQETLKNRQRAEDHGKREKERVSREKCIYDGLCNFFFGVLHGLLFCCFISGRLYIFELFSFIFIRVLRPSLRLQNWIPSDQGFLLDVVFCMLLYERFSTICMFTESLLHEHSLDHFVGLFFLL